MIAPRRFRKGHTLFARHNDCQESVAFQAVGATFQALRHDLAVLPLKLNCELPLFLA
jgi:hypothetical protein